MLCNYISVRFLIKEINQLILKHAKIIQNKHNEHTYTYKEFPHWHDSKFYLHSSGLCWFSLVVSWSWFWQDDLSNVASNTAPNASIELKKNVISDYTSSYDIHVGYTGLGFSLNPPRRTTRKQHAKAIQLQQFAVICKKDWDLISLHCNCSYIMLKMCITVVCMCLNSRATFSVYIVLIFNVIIYSIGS